jgi:acylphosphatase
MTVRKHVWVRGHVQGVWFREATRRAAQALGVSGWVRNLPDGRVEAVFEGDVEPVERALGFVRQGPPHARVEGIEVRDETPLGGAAGFEVR